MELIAWNVKLKEDFYRLNKTEKYEYIFQTHHKTFTSERELSSSTTLAVDAQVFLLCKARALCAQKIKCIFRKAAMTKQKN